MHAQDTANYIFIDRDAESQGDLLGRTLLAHLSGPYEGQFVELRSVPLRIGNPENPLGSGRDGPIYASDHRVWRAPWRSRRRGAVPDVSASDSWSTSAKISQLGSRS